MTKFANNINTTLKEAKQDVWSRMKSDGKETWRAIKRPLKRDAAGNIKNGEIADKIGGVALSGYMTTLDLAGAGLMLLLQGFTKIGDGLVLDNWVIDWLNEKYANRKVKKNKKGKAKVIPKLTKKFSHAAAYATYYAMLLGLLGGAYGVYNKDNIKENIKDRIENLKRVLKPKKTIYDVKSDSFKQDFLDEQWPEIVVGLLEFETYRTIPKPQGTEKRQTYGPGVTWVYENGVQNKCIGDYVNKAKGFSEKEVWNQVRQHCLYQGECMSKIQQEAKKYGFETLSDNQILALLLVGYQLPSRLSDGSYKDANDKYHHYDGIIHRLKDAGDNKQKIVDAFIAGPEVLEKYRKGTNVRSWWCAMLYTGKVSVDEFLDMKRDVFSRINLGTVMKHKHFAYDDASVKYAMEKIESVTKDEQEKAKEKNQTDALITVREFMNSQSVLQGLDKQVGGKTVRYVNIDLEPDNKSMEQMLAGLKAYESQDYDKAIKHYKKAIKLDETNMEAYSSLALSYKKRGDITNNISDYEKAIQVVQDLAKETSQATEEDFFDYGIMAAAYFNSGMAYEESAKIYESNGNMAKAKESYNNALQDYRTARDNAKKADISTKVYDQAVDRLEKVVIDKKDAFTKATTKLKDKLKKKQQKQTKQLAEMSETRI